MQPYGKPIVPSNDEKVSHASRHGARPGTNKTAAYRLANKRTRAEVRQATRREEGDAACQS